MKNPFEKLNLQPKIEPQRPENEDKFDAQKVSEKFKGQKIINGIKINVGWDSDYDDYTIYFPQIELGEEAREKGVFDQVIRVTSRDDAAKQIFDYAVKLAEAETDVYELYKKVEEHAHTLSHDDKE